MSESFAHGLVGVTLDGRYRLDAVLGEGGMGSVFRATQLAMDRKVAVKLLKPHLTTDQVALQRFANEARSTLKVDSPHAVKVLDFGATPLGDWYMVLEYLDGRTVQKELEVDGPFAPARVAHIARQTLEALAAAHRQGLVHRDIKPDNLLLMRVGSDSDYTKVLDFGVAKLMQGAAGPNLALTAAGMVFGTPEFMSPEQACGYALDGRSDLYSLAATMFAMLTGTALFEGKSAIEWLTHHARTPPPHLAMVSPALAAYPALDDLLQRCLAKHREKRPSSAEEMAALIAELEPTLARGEAAPAGTSEPTVFGASSYFHALPRSTVAAGDTIVPEPRAASGSTSEMLRRVKGRRRGGLLFVLGGIAIASLIGVAIGVAIRRTSAHATLPPADAQVAHDAAAGDAGRDAPLADATPIDAPPAPTHVVTPHHNDADAAARLREAEEHLREAETGYRTGNLLKQLSNADAALKANPRSVRARFLYGDALLTSGQKEPGCAALRPLGRNEMAVQRAKEAGCSP